MEQSEYVRQQALEHARALGCDCEPDIAYTTQGKVMNLTIAHDDDCALMVNTTTRSRKWNSASQCKRRTCLKSSTQRSGGDGCGGMHGARQRPDIIDATSGYGETNVVQADVDGNQQLRSATTERPEMNGRTIVDVE